MCTYHELIVFNQHRENLWHLDQMVFQEYYQTKMQIGLQRSDILNANGFVDKFNSKLQCNLQIVKEQI